jgi:hypothetical protein
MGEEGNSQTHTQQGDRISLLLFFENKKSRLKIAKFSHGVTHCCIMKLCICQVPNYVTDILKPEQFVRTVNKVYDVLHKEIYELCNENETRYPGCPCAHIQYLFAWYIIS